MSKKVFIAEQETLLEVQEQVEKLVRNLVPDDAPIYGMVIHEASDLNPSTRVEYLGANKDFTPMSMNMSTHAMNYGSWADWDWLKANVPVMCNWDGGIDYFLDPDDYTKKADGTNSDAANIDYAGDAMAIVKKIYKKEYKVGNDRYVYFCERKVDDDFHAVGFNVLGKERDYMLIPMFYGSIDSNGKMRSIAGQWSCLTASGSAADNATGKAIGTAEQYTAIQAASSKALFFGGALTNTLADICILLSKSTDSQTAFGSGMCSTYVEDKTQHYGTKINTVIGGGQFYGSNDNKSFNKIFHSCVRDWYEKEALEQTWSVATLQRNISSQYYYRMLQTQRQDLVENEMKELTAGYQNDKYEFIKSPVIAEFLGFAQNTDFTESDLEKSILSNLQKFLMELGKGYAFVARQQHIHTEKQDYYIDLVFYNYILKCFVLIDLKTEKISHADVGQMDMYIRMYDELKRGEGDNPTIGIVLCSDTDEDIARYSVMHGNEQLFASKYKLYLPTEEELKAESETQKAMFYLQQQENEGL